MVGTSASAPHAAGAAALLMQHDRAAGQPSDPDTIARELIASALDLDSPGPDAATGAGRIRLDVDPPAWLSTSPAAGQPVGATARFDIAVDDAGTIEASGVSIDGVPAAEVAGVMRLRLDTRALAAGPHTAVFWARDMAGNRSEQPVVFVRDGTQPAVALSKTGSALEVAVSDPESRSGRLVATIDGSGGRAALAAHAAADVRRGHGASARRRAAARARPAARAHPGLRRGRPPLAPSPRLR